MGGLEPAVKSDTPLPAAEQASGSLPSLDGAVAPPAGRRAGPGRPLGRTPGPLARWQAGGATSTAADAAEPHATDAGAAGLVTWAITARVSIPPGQEVGGGQPSGLAQAGLWKPGFPSPELVKSAAALWEPVPYDGGEGPRPAIYIGPGVIAIRRTDLAKRERTLERAAARRQRQTDLRVQMALRGEAWSEPEPSREVTEWSSDSIANMVERLGSLDWSPLSSSDWPPAATTLTYPGGEDGHWLETAPDGKTVKTHIRKFDERYFRAWGHRPVYCWKFEFQRRGAPHFHLFGKTPLPDEKAGEHRRAAAAAELVAWEAAGRPGPPSKRYRPAVGDGLGFRQWVAAVWSDIVGEPDPIEREKHRRAGTRVDWIEGMRYSDPRRLAVYFSKHGTFREKAYQNVVPEAWRAPGKGPGRFWGYKGLEPAVQGVLIESEDALWAERIMRRWSRAQGITREVRVPRTRGGGVVSKYPEVIGLAGAQLVAAHRVRWRKLRRPVVRFAASAGGFMCVNDGPAYASQLVRAVELARRPVEQGGFSALPRRPEQATPLHGVAALGTPVLVEHLRAWLNSSSAPPVPPGLRHRITARLDVLTEVPDGSDCR